MRKYYLFYYIATISFLAISCNLSNNSKNNQATNPVSIDNAEERQTPNLKEESKAEWENENFLSNCSDFEKDLSDKAKKGDAEAIKDLGILFLMPTNLHSRIRQDEKLAVSLLTQAADKGDLEAQFDLYGVYYGYYGSGDYKDENKGKKWLEKAAEGGYAPAEARIAYNYAMGKDGYPQDYAEALKWRKRLAVKGSAPEHIEAQYNVGWQYLKGKGVEKDEFEAMKWFGMAADNGDKEALRILRKYGMAR